MDRKYKIDDQFLFVPKKNTLSSINSSNESITLGTNESCLLSYFIENRHKTLSRNELISVLWEARDIYVGDSSLTQSVSTLRRALNDSTKLPNFIKTVPKSGYEFIASVEDLSSPQINPRKQKLIVKPSNTSEDHLGGRGVLSPQYLVTHKLMLRFEIFTIALVMTLILAGNY